MPIDLRNYFSGRICWLILLSACFSPLASAQATDVTYPAAYFQQWNPVTAADMIDRIPGIAIALEDNSSNNQNDRGLGSAESILINGRRLSGKDNDAQSQLSRIPFDQVSHIEIIRGTSVELVGVRNEGQIINVVTNQSSEISMTVSAGLNFYQDDHTEPAGSWIINGSSDRLDYRVGLERRAEYQVIDSIEESVYGTGNFAPNDLRLTYDVTDQVDQVFTSNTAFAIDEQQTFVLNLQYEESDPPRNVDRTILDYNFQPPAVFREREQYDSERQSWEVGADYNRSFADASNLQLLAISNRQDYDTLRNRFRVLDDSVQQDLAIQNDTVSSEEIVRAVYNRPLTESQSIEFGLERAQTTLETSLALSRLNASGNLVSVAVPNANSEIQEVRYEGFTVHNWQINSRMRLESTLLYETSEITQSGDVSRSRDFDFVRPKLDYRFNISPNLQFQFAIEKFVAQLSFADFAANTDPRDEERDTVAGNPELRQEQSWRYTSTLEYRFSESRGVINLRAWHWDITDAMGRIDATEPNGPLTSAAGNIGDAEVQAIQINASFRPQPNLLLSASVLGRQSEVVDPFSGQPRRHVPNDRGFYTLGLRHDVTSVNLNYGFDYRDTDQGNRPLYDINRIDHLDSNENVTLFVEKSAITSLGLVARLEMRNVLDRGACRDRFRYDDILAVGQLIEVERRCNERGDELVLELRGTF